MTLGSQEHYDIMTEFEKRYKYKLDREDKSLWPMGHIYCNGAINAEFLVFRDGYALGRCVYINH